jgi:hypothetical protein
MTSLADTTPNFQLRAVIRRLESERNAMAAKLFDMDQALERSCMDMSLCRHCGKPVICLPDGLSNVCDPCSEMENAPCLPTPGDQRAGEVKP